ncbi:MAG: hypothetical protein K2H16_08240 [Prevotella sp.]|nr:hypothetical protein [Prevotella sp.]
MENLQKIINEFREKTGYELSIIDGKLRYEGSLDLCGCIGLTSLPNGLVVGSLDLGGCTGLTSLPNGLVVGSWLNLRGCTGLTSLPSDLVVGGSLNLYGCIGLTSLPSGLVVGGLDLEGFAGLTSLA